MSDDVRPVLAITMGDPAGIGPEVVLKALQHADVYARCRPLVLGDRRILERAAPWVGATDLDLRAGRRPSSAAITAPGRVTLLDMDNAAPEDCPVGQVERRGRARGGRVCVSRLRPGDGRRGGCGGHCAAEQGRHEPGRLRLRRPHRAADRAHRRDEVSMLLVGPQLRIVHVSTHVALAEAIRRVTPRARPGDDRAGAAMPAWRSASPRRGSRSPG